MTTDELRQLPLPTDELRPRMEQLLGRLATGYLASLGPMERTLVHGIIRGRGWDLQHLASGRGPLAPVSDYGLAVLVRVFAEELNALDALGLAPWYVDGPPPEPVVEAALGELREAMAR